MRVSSVRKLPHFGIYQEVCFLEDIFGDGYFTPIDDGNGQEVADAFNEAAQLMEASKV